MNAPNGPASQAGPPLTVLVVDDEELTRTGLRALLSAQPDLAVVGEAADGEEALTLVKRLRPDVVLMDVRMPRMDGIEATRQLRAELSEPPRVVVITTFENDAYVWDALVAGASGFIRKRAPTAQIAHAIRLVATGDSVLFPDAVRRLAGTRLEPAPDPAPDPTPPPAPAPASAPALAPAPGAGAGAPALTGREREILRLMAEGLANQEISARLTVSLETVKTHVGNVLTKLHANNRTHAVVLAYEAGALRPAGGAPAPH